MFKYTISLPKDDSTYEEFTVEFARKDLIPLTSRITRLLGRYLLDDISSLVGKLYSGSETDAKTNTEESYVGDMIHMIFSVLGNMTPDDVVELGLIILNMKRSKENKAFVEDHFDFAWYIDGVGKLFKLPPFKVLVENFFGKMD